MQDKESHKRDAQAEKLKGSQLLKSSSGHLMQHRMEEVKGSKVTKMNLNNDIQDQHLDKRNSLLNNYNKYADRIQNENLIRENMKYAQIQKQQDLENKKA